MTARKKTIKKPKFIITYSISFLIVLAVFTCVGAIVYHGESSEYYARVETNARENWYYLENEINNFNDTDKEKITRSDIVSLKRSLVKHYSMTGQYIEVHYDNEIVVDAKNTIILDYSVGDGTAFYKTYYLEIADKKYMDRFNDPELLKLRENDGDNTSLYQGLEGLRTQPYLGFVCNEFYADFENCKFVPVKCTFISPVANGQPKEIVVNITPSPKDIQGYTLINNIDDSDDTAYACMEGLEGQPEEGYDTGRPLHLADDKDFLETPLTIKSFEAAYSKPICIAIIVFVISVFLVALIPASIRYNIDKRNYEVFQYRLKTTNAMAHDLKTPLAAIAGYAESLSYHIGSDKQEYYAEKIEDKVSQMTGMINNILEFSKSEALTGKVTTADTDIGSIIAEAIADNEYKISSRDLKVNYDQKEVIVKTDKELFKQALDNLIGNAVLHSKEGTEIDITCDSKSVVIVNTAAEKIDDIKSIREPFVKGSESRGDNGSGLGLAIADNNLAMLRYRLEIKTEDDKFYAIVYIK